MHTKDISIYPHEMEKKDNFLSILLSHQLNFESFLCFLGPGGGTDLEAES